MNVPDLRRWRHVGRLKQACTGTWLGLDPSFGGYGACILDQGEVWVGEAAFPAGPSRWPRIVAFVDGLARLQTLQGVCFEGMVNSPTNGIHSGAVGALTRFALVTAVGERIPLWDCAPSVHKALVTGKGGGDKSSTKLHLYKLTGIDLSEGTDNESDALALALVAASLGGGLAIGSERVQKLSKVVDINKPATKETTDGRTPPRKRARAA